MKRWKNSVIKINVNLKCLRIRAVMFDNGEKKWRVIGCQIISTAQKIRHLRISFTVNFFLNKNHRYYHHHRQHVARNTYLTATKIRCSDIFKLNISTVICGNYKTNMIMIKKNAKKELTLRFGITWDEIQRSNRIKCI